MKKIGRYTLTGRLGRGGMSTVYKARAPVTARTVALKILKPRDDIFIDLVGERRLQEIFVEEARIMGEITHDHIAKIIDCDESHGAPFIILEYFAHSVGALIGEAYVLEKPSRIISVNKAYSYIRQTLLGLERLHFAGIVHRDLKPYNLMITNDDRIKIIDFGLSRVRGEEKMAIPGMQVGSPYYAAPEQERNPRNADERADLYSVGIMAYRLITGLLVSHRQDDIAPPSSLNSDVTEAWDVFLLKSIHRDADKRFDSAQQMRLRLEELHAGWKHQSKKSCTFIASDQAGPAVAAITLRSAPAIIRIRELRKSLKLDSLMRPKAYVPHRFQYKTPLLLECLDSGLLWQRKAAGFMLTWSQAHDYISYLNDRGWQGSACWRLPTTEELHTLLRPPTRERDFCFDSYFAEEIHWIWSCDTCSRNTAWTVDIKESFFQELDKDGMASVCAVTSLAEPAGD